MPCTSQHTFAQHDSLQSFAAQPARSRRAAFTLIELLVVIAIIALLVGILLPALANARKTAQQGKCLANARQIGVVMNLYANDWKNWYPLIPMNQQDYNNFTTAGSLRFLDGQWNRGGFAGFFSLYQNPDGGDAPPTGDYTYVGGGTPASGAYAPRQGVPASSQPVLASYMTGYGVLTCPADRQDRYMGDNQQFNTSNSRAFTQNKVKFPKTPGSEYEVIHYNISYMYIAGFKTDEGVILKPAPLVGDETDCPDLSTRAWYQTAVDFGTDPAIRPGYYQKWDNHGADGADWVFTDGHGELVKYDIGTTFFNGSQAIVNVIDTTRSRRVNTTD